MNLSSTAVGNRKNRILWPRNRLPISDYFAIAFIIFLLAPQTTIYGRGELSVGCFFFWFLFTSRSTHKKTVSVCSPLLIALLLQIGIYVAKSTPPWYFQPLIHSSVGFLTLTLSIYFTTYYLVNAPDRFFKIRVFGLIGFAISLSYSLLIVWQEPGIGRMLVFDGASSYSMTLRLKGVPGYPQIYTLAMCAPLFLYSAKRLSGRVRILYIGAIAIFFGHIILSTLTLASVLFVISIAFWIINDVKKDPKKLFFSLLLISLFIVREDITRKFDFSSFPQVERVVLKTERILSGITTEGLVDGDETGRGVRIQSSFDTFLEYPIFGIPFDEYNMTKIGGHSSFVDALGQFGIFGYMPMWFFLIKLTRNGLKIRKGKHFVWHIEGLLAWLFFWCVSFWNTSTFTVLPYAVFFLPIVRPKNEKSPVSTGIIINSKEFHQSLARYRPKTKRGMGHVRGA